MIVSQKSKSGTFCVFIISIILPFIFMLPVFLEIQNLVGPALIGDNLGVWLSHLSLLDWYIENSILSGVDYFTHGGASEIFLRINLPNHNPIILFLLLIFDVDSPNDAYALYYITWYIFAAISAFYTMKLFKFFGAPLYLGIAAAILLTLGAFQLTAQYFVFLIASWTLPVAIYSVLAFFRKQSINAFVQAILALLLCLFSGYLPIGLTLFIIVNCIGLLYLFSDPRVKIFNFTTFKTMIIKFSPSIFAALIAFPIYLSVVLRIDRAKIWTPSGIDNISHNFGARTHEFLRIFSPSFQTQYPQVENEYLLGLIFIVCVVLAVIYVKRIPAFFGNKLNRFSALAAVFFVIGWFPIYGDHTVFSEFYHALPILGSLRIFQRNIIWAAPLLSLFVPVALYILIRTVPKQALRYALIGSIFSIILCAILFAHSGKEVVNFGTGGVIRGTIIIELLYLISALACMLIMRRHLAIPIVCALMTLPALNHVYELYTHGHTNRIMFDKRTQFLITDHLLAHSDKELIRLIDMSPDFAGQPPKNHSWLSVNQTAPRVISSFVGHDLHGAVGGEYPGWTGSWQIINGKHYYIPQWRSMADVEAEFVLYDVSRENSDDLPGSAELRAHLDLSDSTKILNLPQIGLRLAPLKYDRSDHQYDFNNGIFGVMGSTNNITADTNFATKSTLILDSDEQTTIKYLLWPKDNSLKFYVNDREITELKRVNGLAVFELPAGQNKVEVIYVNWLYSFGLYLYLFAFIAGFIILLVPTARRLYAKFPISKHKRISLKI